ncbi:hypothetical protein BS78_05G274800 [Paspalum vaginatum]|nr:hypothetical protein BS78_05G274800 [Paspalum vaginatum]
MMDGMAGGGNPPSAADNNSVATEVFIVDSGASVHATGDRRVFSHLSVIVQPESSTAATRRSRSRAHVRVANGSELPIHGFGTVRRDHITLHGVLFVPGLSKNIVSVPKLTERGYTVEFTHTRCFIRDAYGATAGQASLVNGLYELDFLQDPRD